MELILYVKNNIWLILIFIINNCIINYAVAENNNKYHTLQVLVNITEDPTLAETIKKDLLIFHATFEPKLTKNRIEHLHDRANQEIINNLQALGYYHSKIIKTSLESIGHNQWVGSYDIAAGSPIIIKQIQLQILNNQPNQEIYKKIQSASRKLLFINKQLNHEHYEKTKQLIISQLHDDGFLNAQFTTSKIEIDLKTNTANIIFILDPMQQYYLGCVKFESNLYNNDFLNKYIPFKEMDLYSTEKLMKFKNNLLNSGLFSKVRIDIENISNITNNVVPVIARVYEKPANKYTGSIGFGTDTGIRGNIGYVRRRQSHPGHEISINLAGSKIRKQAIADYSFLGEDPMSDKYNIGAIAIDEHIRERFNKNAEFYAQKSKKKATRQQIWKLSFLTEIFRELPELPKKQAKFLMPSMRLIWINSKNTTDFGNKISLTAKVASKTMSSANLLQLIITEKWLHPLIYDFRLIFRGSIATTFINDFNKLPLSLRFFAGGDNSVRGFAYNSLGPIIGGKHLFFSSLEIEKPIPAYPQLSVSWFIDAGNALNTFNNFKFNKLAVGSGIGTGYKTPVGSFRVYIAQPIKYLNLENTAKKRVRLHLTFSTDL